MANKRLIKKLETYKKKVLQFNEDLEVYYKVDPSRELPIIESTLIGFDPFEPYEIEDLENGFKVNADGLEIYVTIEVDEDGEEFISGWDDGYDNLKESIQYDRRRLNKAWKVWKSENPDVELEKVFEDE